MGLRFCLQITGRKSSWIFNNESWVLHLEYCVSVWSPQYTKNKELLERVQHIFTRMIKEVSDKDYLDRLQELNLWTLEERRNRADLIELFKITGITTVHFESLFTLDCNNKGTRGHLAKLHKPRCQKDVRKYFFSHRVINRWNALDGETVSSSSINAFKTGWIKSEWPGWATLWTSSD